MMARAKPPIAKPAIKWLDLSRAELRRARNLIRDWQGEGVIDELGFGIIQSAIADRLYPATSTIMTRSRYLYFLPAIYRRLEMERVPPAAVEERARTLQDELREALARTERQDVIGRSAQIEIRRLPIDIHWSALRKLRIFLRPFSEAAHHARLKECWRAPKVAKHDDGRLRVEEEIGPSWVFVAAPETPAFLDDLERQLLVDDRPRYNRQFSAPTRRFRLWHTADAPHFRQPSTE